MSVEREALWTRVDKAAFLTANEKRSAVGCGPLEGGDEIKAGSDPSCRRQAPSMGLIPSDNFVEKLNPYHDELGRFTNAEGAAQGGGLVHTVSRRRGGRREGTPAQEARHAAARIRAQAARRQLRELDPDWHGPESALPLDSVEGQIRHEEAVAEAAGARLAEILRDSVPNTNSSWGVNRLRRELNDQGYVLRGPATRGGSSGILLENAQTGGQVRIMERPSREPFRNESEQKFHNQFYYRYKPANGPWGSHITIPDR